MADSNEGGSLSQGDGKSPRIADFLKLAKDADASGDSVLSMHLYLAAFQKSAKMGSGPSEDAVNGLKQAWVLACSSKQRSMAEYIFELMEPFLSGDEISACAEQLQGLAFDKLAEIGLSRNDLEGMAEAVSEELLAAGELSSERAFEGVFAVLPSPLSPSASRKEAKRKTSGEHSGKDAADSSKGANTDPIDGALKDVLSFDPTGFDYSKLAGYDKTISLMRDLGVGAGSDPDYSELVELLNRRHGLSSAPALDSMLFRADAREDANRFALATVGEIGLPAVHMRMEEGFQASPVLCISTYNADVSGPASLRKAFSSGGVLVLENLDLWESPVADSADDANPLLVMQMTRGAREAIGFIRSAVDSPDVSVIATASPQGVVDEFFLELLEPLTLIDISLPDEQERLDVWMDISKNHPSLRQIDKDALVKYSANMPRFDMYMAARDAVEEAYKMGLACRRYVPITSDNMFDKLASYQPLESEEYGELEDEMVSRFRGELDDIDAILGGE